MSSFYVTKASSKILSFGNLKVKYLLTIFFVLSSIASILAQDATLYGIVKDDTGSPIPGANVTVLELENTGVSTDNDGNYSITLPADRPLTIKYSFIGFNGRSINLTLERGQVRRMNVRLKAGVDIGPATVTAVGDREKPIQTLEPRINVYLASARGTVEDVLLQAPVNFTSELSSSYNVRGGSFDENLVYVNGIQVYRPFLVRAGQQEGLSFPNTDMIESIEFSAGGFEAKYGDKMSSVLDIKYRKPKEFGGSVTASLLGASVQLEGITENKKLSHNSGFRYRNNSYVLGSLDTQGDYNPRYTDFQTYITFDPDSFGPWEFNFLGNFSQNKYNFIPQTRQTDIGNINEALRLTVFFDGQEETGFQTYFGAFNTSYTTDVTRLTFTTSGFRTFENETFDILGQYFLDELERDLGSDEFGEVLANRGIGSYLEHARNDLDASVYNFSHKGSHLFEAKDHFLEWGTTLQYEEINDRLSEWTLIDSAGYNSPHPQDSIGYELPFDRPFQEIILSDVVKAENNISSNRISAYVQDSKEFKIDSSWVITANIGLRGQYWTFNNQFVGGPRANFSFKPKWYWNKEEFDNGETDTLKTKDIVFKLAGGYYWQPPFYREMRGIDGSVNPDIRAQRAIHAVAGVDYIFKAWGRPFKLIGEVYYKDMDYLIPYEVENVRLRYYATNNSSGYAVGSDLMVNGEFIPGIQSFFRASVLKTEENLSDDSYFENYNTDGDLIIEGFTLNDTIASSVLVEPGFIPRPTDQRFSFSMIFSDEMPKWPEYKVYVSMFYGTGLPFGPPTFERYLDINRTAAYRRVDIGFSRDIVTKKTEENGKLTWMKTGFVSLEIFNILGINNTINHTWIEDVNGRQYAIPNFLTGRRINFKLAFKF